jgi:hypothetical protein
MAPANPPQPDAKPVASDVAASQPDATGTSMIAERHTTQGGEEPGSHICSTAHIESMAKCGCIRGEGKLVKLQETVDEMMRMMRALQPPRHHRHHNATDTSSRRPHQHGSSVHMEAKGGRHGRDREGHGEGMPASARPPPAPAGGMSAGDRHVPGMFDRSRVPSGNLFHHPLRRPGYSASFSTETRGRESQAAQGSSHDPHSQPSHRRPSGQALESNLDFVLSRPMSLQKDAQALHERARRMSGVGSMQKLSDLFDSEHPPADEAPAREGSQDNAFESASRGFSRSVASHSCACEGSEGIGENQRGHCRATEGEEYTHARALTRTHIHTNSHTAAVGETFNLRQL